ncbi:hypothetical protein M0R89_03875 [Halorussus limi]|uniref:DUF7847 domain-containing protein n=1 Tax=Halorussus limi TaxID=2938695 RepID=A0A8U0HXB3_9EURY|nr:hypothetical protein [Halorussus limi]UPV75214.1 hypothetical protein M0R89_03875 [Halorussus limi]
MPIDIGDVVSDGYERTVARNGLLFIGIFYLISLLEGLFLPTPTQSTTLPDPMGGPGMGPVPAEGMQPYAPSLGFSPVITSLLSLLLGIISIVVTIGALRTFVTEETEQIPEAHFRHNLLWAGLNLIIGGIIFGITIAIGFIFLVVPGLFLLVSLFFWEVYVAVEDQNFIEGFRNSWQLTSGHRLRLFGLGIVIAIIAMLVSIGFGIPGIVLPDILGFLIAQFGSAFLGVFFLATVAQTYNHLLSMENKPGVEISEKRM